MCSTKHMMPLKSREKEKEWQSSEILSQVQGIPNPFNLIPQLQVQNYSWIFLCTEDSAVRPSFNSWNIYYLFVLFLLFFSPTFLFLSTKIALCKQSDIKGIDLIDLLVGITVRKLVQKLCFKWVCFDIISD